MAKTDSISENKNSDHQMELMHVKAPQGGGMDRAFYVHPDTDWYEEFALKRGTNSRNVFKITTQNDMQLTSGAERPPKVAEICVYGCAYAC